MKSFEDLCREAHAAVAHHGAVFTAARALGLSESTLRGRYHAALTRYGLDPILTPVKGQHAAFEQATPVTRREAHDSAFWQKQALALKQELAKVEMVAEEVAGLRGIDIEIPDWLLDTHSSTARAVVGCLISDVHAGEVVDPDEILGLNEFNPEICRRRLRRYFSAAATIGRRWGADCTLDGALVVLAGDLISGDIHEELRITNALTAHEQVSLVVEEITSGIRHLAGIYGRVHVVSVPGNHGRTTHKPTAKLYSRLSYDTLAASMIRDRLLDDGRFTWQISASRDAIVPVYGRDIFINHGDGMGSGGGMGFIGPMAPIVRGTKKVEAQQARVNRRPSLILHGHYHTSGQPGPVLSNGSVPGYTEYGNGLRASVEPPQQWLFLLHSKWGLRERVEVQLEDPVAPAKPRVAIPARIAEA